MTSHLGELYRGERVLWTGSPQRYPFLERRDILSMPMVLVPCLALALWVQYFPHPQGLVIVAGWGFVAIGVYWTVSPIIARNLYLRHARYRITTQRVIVDSTIFGRHNVHSAYLKDLPPPLIKRLDGTVGTIVFGTSKLRDHVTITRDGIHIVNTEWPPVLVEVNDAQRVRDLIVSTQTDITS